MSSKKKIQSSIDEAEEYLVTIREQIDNAIADGNEALRDLQDEVESLQKEKATLLKELISIRQDIDLAKNNT